MINEPVIFGRMRMASDTADMSPFIDSPERLAIIHEPMAMRPTRPPRKRGPIFLGHHGEALDVASFRKVAEQSAALRTILLRHEQVLFAQAEQSVACNISHPVEAPADRPDSPSKPAGSNRASA